MKSPFPPKTRKCHCTAFTKGCFDLVVTEESCQGRWVNIKGVNPQNKDEVYDNWGCVDDFTHILHLAAAIRVWSTAARCKIWVKSSTQPQLS